MCTAINLNKNNQCYFGRNLDLDYPFDAKIICVPSNYDIHFKKEKNIKTHYAFFGFGIVVNDYPLLGDGANEKGLAIAGLNFVGNAKYNDYDTTKKNYAPYELPLIILSTCKSIKEVKELMKDVNIVDIDFAPNIPNHDLHFIVSDKNGSIVIEQRKDGLHVFDNPFNVLTNNPPFEYHFQNVSNYAYMSNESMVNNLMKDFKLDEYCLGLGAYGLPGDYSSTSRFIKVLFVKNNILLDDKTDDVINFFKCLDSVLMPKGAVKSKDYFEYTQYSNCYDLINLTLYYKTYESAGIVKFAFKDFKDIVLHQFDLNNNCSFNIQNY